MHDVVVVGARCAGAATAMLLARAGLDVLVVDRARMPSDVPHGHFIHRHGPTRLQEWGLLDPVLATGCPPITSMVFDLDDFPLRGEGLEVDGVPVGLAPRRVALDAVLVEAAVAAGATFRDGFAVDDLLSDDGRVTGVRGRDGTREPARFVVGADGRNSLVARRVGAPALEDRPTLTCWYFSYWSGVPGDALEIYTRGRRVVFAFPTNDELFGVFVSWPIEELEAVRRDPQAHLLAVVDEVPELAERVRSGRQEERLYGATHLPNYLRQAGGPGWALVGDAGSHKDPFLALGVCDAFRDASFLADALLQALGGSQPEAEALGSYERRRNDATMRDFHVNVAFVTSGPPPELLEQRAQVRGDAAATARHFLEGEGRLR